MADIEIRSIVERSCGQLAAAQSHLDKALHHLQQALGAMVGAGGEHAYYVFQPLYRSFQYGMPTGKALDEVKTQLTKRMNEKAWLYLCDNIKLDQLMSHQQCLDFKEELYNDPPPFTPDEVAQRFFYLAEHREEIALDGLIQTFRSLNFKFKSHDRFNVNQRVILTGITSLDYLGAMQVQTHSDGIRHLRDLIRGTNQIIHPGRRFDPAQDVLVRLVAHVAQYQGEPLEMDYLTIKVCKNGNAHVWFSDRQVADRINDVLANHYGATLGHQPA